METNNFEGSIKLQLFKSEDAIEKISDYTIEEDYSLEVNFNNKYFTFLWLFQVIKYDTFIFSDRMPMQMKYKISDNLCSVLFNIAFRRLNV